MPPSLIHTRILLILRTADPNRITLRIQSPSSQQQLPMQRPRRMVKTARIDQHACSLLSHQQAKLGESEVVANSESDFAEFGVEDADFVAWLEGVGFFVGYLARDVDIEEMDFVHLSVQFAFRVDNKGSIIIHSLAPRILLPRYRPNRIHRPVPTHSLNNLQRRRIPEILSKLDHIIARVGRIADLSKNGDLGAVLAGCFEGFFYVRLVLGFVWDALCLQDCQFEGFQAVLHGQGMGWRYRIWNYYRMDMDMVIQLIIIVFYTQINNNYTKKMSKTVLIVLTLLILSSSTDPTPDDLQIQQQQFSMKRTACLVLSRYHSNSQKDQLESIISELAPEQQQKYINKMYATAIEFCLPKITMDEAQKFFVEDANFRPDQMFYIFEGFDYANVDISSFTKAQENLVKFIKNFDEEMQVKREEKQAEKDTDAEQGFSMKFFGLTASDIPSSAKYVYLLIFGGIVGGSIWYLMSKVDDGKTKKGDKRKKSPGKPASASAASPSPNAKSPKAAKKQ